MQNAQNAVDENWAFLYDIVRILGRDGMSSDESEPEEGRKVLRYKRCRVKRRQWRSREIDDLMKLIDRERAYKNAFGNDPAGTRPRVRIRPAHTISQNVWVPPFLPRNFYDTEWYDNLPAQSQTSLHAKPPMKMIRFEDDDD